MGERHHDDCARRRQTASGVDAESSSGALTGYEAKLWQMADALRGSMDAAEYKHVVLGLIFLKYISDAFQELHAWLESKTAEGYDPEDMDEYRGENISSGCLRRLVGLTSRRRRGSRPSDSWWTMP